MKRSPIRCWMAMLALSSLASYAREQRLSYQGTFLSYALSFDDSRISVQGLRRLVVLSPYRLSVPGTPFQTLGDVDRKDGDEITGSDKVFGAPWLGDCFEIPCRHDPEVVDAAFLRDAAINLKRGADQVQLLRKERVPAVLEPVKVYLLAYLEHSLDLHRALYAYLKSADLAPMQRILCQACPCGAAEQALLEQLRTERDPERRVTLSLHDGNNRVVECDARLRPTRYPLDAWLHFLKEYGITEHRIWQPVD